METLSHSIPRRPKVLLRQYKGEMQQLGKLEDLKDKVAPRKTGVERRTPSKEERELIRQVNKEKRKGDYEVTDPEQQLKSTKGALETRLRNEIEDMTDAIETGQRMTKRKLEPMTDKDIVALRKQRDAKKAEYDKAFPKEPITEKEQITRIEAALDSSIKQLEADIKDRKLYSTSEKNTLTSEGIEVKRARLAELRAERDLLRSLDAETVEFKKEKDLEERIAKAQEGPKPKKEKAPTVDSQRVTELKGELQQIQDDQNSSIEVRMQRAEDAVDRSIAKVEEEIKNGVSTTTGKPEPLSSPELDAKRKILEDLRKQRDALLGPKIETEEQKIARLERSIKMIKDPPKPKEPAVTLPDTEEAAALREELRALREARLNDPVRKLNLWKAAAAKRHANLLERVATGDVLAKKRKPIELDAEALETARKINETKKEFLELRHKLILENRTLPTKIAQEALHVINTGRAMMTSFDLSATGRQGILLGLSHPVSATEALFKSLKAFVSRKSQLASYKEVMSRPNASLYGETKLFLPDPEEYTLSKMEEAYMTRLIDGMANKKLKGKWKALALPQLALKGVQGSQQAYLTFLTVLRANAFDTLMKTARGGGGGSLESATAIANYINIATGRGNLAGSGGNAAVSLNALLFSPRLLVSRFQYLSGAPLVKGIFSDVREGGARQALSRGSAGAIIAKEYMRTATGLGVMVGLGVLAGAEFEDELTSSDFFKLKFGNTRVDVFGGLLQATVLMSRLAKGETTTISGKTKKLRGPDVGFGDDDTWDVIGRFGRTKLNPSLGAAINLLSGSNVVGEEASPETEIPKLFTPMVWNDFVDAGKEYGWTEGMLAGWMAIMGLGVQTFNPEKAKKEKKAKEAARKKAAWEKKFNK